MMEGPEEERQTLSKGLADQGHAYEYPSDPEFGAEACAVEMHDEIGLRCLNVRDKAD
jgi:hypothetical protein